MLYVRDHVLIWRVTFSRVRLPKSHYFPNSVCMELDTLPPPYILLVRSIIVISLFCLYLHFMDISSNYNTCTSCHVHMLHFLPIGFWEANSNACCLLLRGDRVCCCTHTSWWASCVLCHVVYVCVVLTAVLLGHTNIRISCFPFTTCIIFERATFCSL